ncbi:uncharacterized protein K02A2.6-like [Sabethes cyaneus]|uniref:uncharacterized protein K02A2.6-like n=1 Tax=Sabethes cyaneus TaxID=53552 RepID=UPI00237E1900|nr:uncharacterized protein K02A2.6-like [Sabethes cyaneus]
MERPIAYASCTMSATEQRYPQTDKEALATVWAVKKFFHYLYARKFTLITDHKPLTQILHPEKSLPTLCISRMANYADYLAHFNFDVVYKPTSQNTNANYCSRIPNQTVQSDVNRLSLHEGRNNEDEFEQFSLHQIQQLPVRAEHIARESRKDTNLGGIIQELELGRNLMQLGYKAPEARYTLVANCLLFEHRVVIPPTLRQTILNDLHVGHIGIVKMKGLARSFVYWPGIDADIENTAVGNVHNMHQHHRNSTHIIGSTRAVDAILLRWIICRLRSTNNSCVRQRSSIYCEEFKSFLQRCGVKYHELSAPYHPATNGQAECYVQTVKNALKSMGSTSNTLQANSRTEFLQQYRKVPHSETGESPTKLFLGRNIRTRFDLVRPQDVSTKIAEKQRATFDSSFRSFTPGQHVYCLSGNPRMDKWIPGIVSARLGDLHYDIVYEGKHLKRHVDQIRRFHDNEYSQKCTQSPSESSSNRTLQFPSNGTENETESEEPFYATYCFDSEEVPKASESRNE